MSTFGKRLRGLRNTKKLTQKELSKRLKISESAVGMYERDEREPSFGLVNEMADLLDTTTDFLIRGREDYKFSKKEQTLTDAIEEGLNTEEIKEKYNIDVTTLTNEEWRGIVAYVQASRAIKSE